MSSSAGIRVRSGRFLHAQASVPASTERRLHSAPQHIVEIRLISTLTSEDEARIAAAICAAAGPLLDHLTIAYTLRIETADGQVFEHHNAPGYIDTRHPNVLTT